MSLRQPQLLQPVQPSGQHQAARSRRWPWVLLGAVPGLVAGVLIGGLPASGTAAGTGTASTAASAPQGYHDPAILERDLKGILAKRLANPSGQYYDPGVTVKSLTCVETSQSAATCLWKLSDGTSGTDGMAISADGSRFITK